MIAAEVDASITFEGFLVIKPLLALQSPTAKIS